MMTKQMVVLPKLQRIPLGTHHRNQTMNFDEEDQVNFDEDD